MSPSQAEHARCAGQSRTLNEPLLGTASNVHSWVLLEQPGPWGTQAIRHSRLPDGLGSTLRALSVRLHLRVVLVRRHRRAARSDKPRCFVIRTDAHDCWTEHTELDQLTDVLDIDLAGLAAGRRPGLDPLEAPLLCVCTHGRHDPCCAELGRPVAKALDERFPDQTWECSHIGGDRFAANLVCFPHGLYFGRLSPSEAVNAATWYAAGRIDLAHLRGRCGYAFAVQAAEVFLRTATGLDGVDALHLVGARRADDVLTARFRTPDGATYDVRVRVGVDAGVARPLSCHDQAPSRPAAYDLIEITPGRGRGQRLAR